MALWGAELDFWGFLWMLGGCGDPLVLWDECLGFPQELGCCFSLCCGAGLWDALMVLLSGFGVPRGAVELCDPSPRGLWAGTFRDAVAGDDSLVLWDVGQNFGIP